MNPCVHDDPIHRINTINYPAFVLLFAIFNRKSIRTIGFNAELLHIMVSYLVDLQFEYLKCCAQPQRSHRLCEHIDKRGCVPMLPAIEPIEEHTMTAS